MTNLELKARAYANSALKAYGDVTVIGLFVSDIIKAVEEAYIQGAKDVLNMPLENRLRAEEVRDIKKLYDKADYHASWLGINFASKCATALERIFGKMVFKKSELDQTK